MNRILLFIILMPLLALAQNNLGFVKESIDFEIDDKVFKTNGIYTLVNYTSNSLNPNIYFPFSKNADSVIVNRVYELSNSYNVVFKKLDNGISFYLKLEPFDTVIFNIDYNQKKAAENSYVLKSTLYWGLPLIEAKYSLSVADDIEIDSLSYLPDTIINNTYYWKKENFMPKSDFKVFVK